MSKNNFVEEEESEIEVVSKKEKKKKTSEEKGKDRKVVFWVLLIVVAMTAAFWLKAAIGGDGFETKGERIENSKTDGEIPEDGGNNDRDGFFVKYDI